MLNEVYVTSSPFTDSAGYTGDRVLICGTYLDTTSNATNIIIVAYNSVYNTSEGIYEEKTPYNETCKAVHWDKYEQRVIAISEIYANKLNKATCYDIGSDPGTISWNIAIRSLSVQGLMLYWTRLIGDPYKDESYGGSSMHSFIIYVAVNTMASNGNHTSMIKSVYSLNGGVVSTKSIL